MPKSRKKIVSRKRKTNRRASERPHEILVMERKKPSRILMPGQASFQSQPDSSDQLEHIRLPLEILSSIEQQLPVAKLTENVGLDRIISAGLMLADLIERNVITRCLIACPASLGPQWAEQLSSNFGIRAVYAEGREFTNAISHTSIPVVITSSEHARFRIASFRAGLFEMILMDDAHGLRDLYAAQKPSDVAKRVRQVLDSGVFPYIMFPNGNSNSTKAWDLYTPGLLLAIAKNFRQIETPNDSRPRNHAKKNGTPIVAPAANEFPSLFSHFVQSDAEVAPKAASPKTDEQNFPESLFDMIQDQPQAAQESHSDDESFDTNESFDAEDSFNTDDDSFDTEESFELEEEEQIAEPPSTLESLSAHIDSVGAAAQLLLSQTMSSSLQTLEAQLSSMRAKKGIAKFDLLAKAPIGEPETSEPEIPVPALDLPTSEIELEAPQAQPSVPDLASESALDSYYEAAVAQDETLQAVETEEAQHEQIVTLKSEPLVRELLVSEPLVLEPENFSFQSEQITLASAPLIIEPAVIEPAVTEAAPAQPEPQAKAEPEPQPVKVELEIKVVSEIKVQPETLNLETDFKPQISLESETKIDSEIKINPELDLRSEITLEPQVKLVPQLKVEPEVDPRSEISLETESSPAAEIRLKTDEEVEQEIQRKDEQDSKTDLNSEIEFDTDIKLDSELDTDSDFDPVSKSIGNADTIITHSETIGNADTIITHSSEIGNADTILTDPIGNADTIIMNSEALGNADTLIMDSEAIEHLELDERTDSPLPTPAAEANQSVITEKSGVEDEHVFCCKTGRRLHVDEAIQSVVSGKWVSSDLAYASVHSGKIALLEELVACEESGVLILPEETGICSVTGKRVYSHYLAKSDFSGQTVLAANLEECSVTGKKGLPTELETCAISGQRAASSEFETCPVSKKRAIRSQFTQSDLSKAYILPEFAIWSPISKRCCTPSEAVTCLWRNSPMPKDEVANCTLTGLTFSKDLLNADGQFQVLRDLLDAKESGTDGESLVNWLRYSIKGVFKKLKRAECTISSDGSTRAVCGEIRSFLGLRTRHAGFIVTGKGAKMIMGKVTVGKRHGKDGGWTAK